MTNAQAALLAAVHMSHEPTLVEAYTRQAKQLLDQLDKEGDEREQTNR